VTVDARGRRVLLLTSSPLEGSEGADKRLAVALAEGLAPYSFMWFTRRPAVGPPRIASGRALPVLSRHGLPGLAERTQIAAQTAALGRQVDLVHAVLTVGRGFPLVSGAARRLLDARPVLHTVPGVVAPDELSAASRLGHVTVALSTYTARQLRSAGFGDVRVVPPAVRFADWPPAPRQTGVPVVLFAGHAGDGEGAAEAVDLAAQAHAIVPLRLVLALRTRSHDEFRRRRCLLTSRARAAGLSDVEVYGHVNSIQPLLTACDLLVFAPVRLAGKADVPLTVIEAMASGRPVLVSDLPQMAALAPAAVVAPAGDAVTGGWLLAGLLSSPRRWDEAVEAGRALVATEFAMTTFLARYRAIYEELMGE
jgi:glycosyltransferase involved in cell wall biosynthesis